MAETSFVALEQKIDDLIGLCTELNQENAALKADRDSWHAERELLVSRNELARHKVESILDRLRTLEYSA